MPVPAPTSSSGRDLLVGGLANIRDLGGLAGVLEDRASGRSHQQKVLIDPRSAT